MNEETRFSISMPASMPAVEREALLAALPAHADL
jgi:hypothetical protein